MSGMLRPSQGKTVVVSEGGGGTTPPTSPVEDFRSVEFSIRRTVPSSGRVHLRVGDVSTMDVPVPLSGDRVGSVSIRVNEPDVNPYIVFLATGGSVIGAIMLPAGATNIEMDLMSAVVIGADGLSVFVERQGGTGRSVFRSMNVVVQLSSGLTSTVARVVTTSARRRLFGELTYSRVGDVSLADVPLRLPPGTIDRMSVGVDQADTEDWVIEVVVNGSVIGSATLLAGFTSIQAVLGSTQASAFDLSVRWRRQGAGPSVFRSHIIAIQLGG